MSTKILPPKKMSTKQKVLWFGSFESDDCNRISAWNLYEWEDKRQTFLSSSSRVMGIGNLRSIFLVNKVKSPRIVEDALDMLILWSHPFHMFISLLVIVLRTLVHCSTNFAASGVNHCCTFVVHTDGWLQSCFRFEEVKFQGAKAFLCSQGTNLYLQRGYSAPGTPVCVQCQPHDMAVAMK